jgi:hypothetical protein
LFYVCATFASPFPFQTKSICLELKGSTFTPINTILKWKGNTWKDTVKESLDGKGNLNIKEKTQTPGWLHPGHAE